jgi:para-nitrobenzyl esterase
VLPKQPLVAFARHEQADIPLIVGSNAREYSNLLGPQDSTPEMFRDWVHENYAPIADDLLLMYPISTPANTREAFITAQTALDLAAPARWTAQAMRGMKSNAYLYEVTWAYPSPGGQDWGAFHGIELLLMFGSRAVPLDSTGDALAEALRAYWVQFARTGNPNVRGLPAWPSYNSTVAPYLDLGRKIRPGARRHQSAFALAKRVYAGQLKSLSP